VEAWGVDVHPQAGAGAGRLMYILWPVTLPALALVRLVGRAFIADVHRLGDLRLEVRTATGSRVVRQQGRTWASRQTRLLLPLLRLSTCLASSSSCFLPSACCSLTRLTRLTLAWVGGRRGSRPPSPSSSSSRARHPTHARAHRTRRHRQTLPSTNSSSERTWTHAAPPAPLLLVRFSQAVLGWWGALLLAVRWRRANGGARNGRGL
jgi:hypothetical protein